MKFDMNGRDWFIKEVPQKAFWDDVGKVQTEEDGSYFGRCFFLKQEIWLDREMSDAQLAKTLYHELVHCYIGCYLTHSMEVYSEDLVCDIAANSHKIIDDIIVSYMMMREERRNKQQDNMFDIAYL